MTDLSNQVVTIKLNPASLGAMYDPTTHKLTFNDASGTKQTITVAPLEVAPTGLVAMVKGLFKPPDNGWWTCWPRRCDY